MKILVFGAAAAAAFSSLVAISPALANDMVQHPSSGHYEWQSPAQFGPRAPLRPRVRIWVRDEPRTAQGMGGPLCEASRAAMRGHYEWRPQPGFGPRAPLRAPVRVWVVDDCN